MPTRQLVRSGELFGISEGATRTAISRMLGAGELESEPSGAAYGLAGPLLGRWDRQAESRSMDVRSPWDGTWTQAVVVLDGRPAADRSALRLAMTSLRLAELREGVWLRPANLDPTRHADAAAIAARQCRWFSLASPADPEVIVASLWDLPGWAVRAEELTGDLERHQNDLVASPPEHLADGFLLDAAALRHLLADPLLPDELLPRDWPGGRLRRAQASYDEAFRRLWRQRFADR